MAHPSAASSKGIWRVITITIAVMAIYYLLTRHAAHTFGALPYLLILNAL
jgi:lipoprotein signal peptidase